MRAKINGTLSFRACADAGSSPESFCRNGRSLSISFPMWLITLRLRRLTRIGPNQLYLTHACSAGLSALASNFSRGLIQSANRRGPSCALFSGVKQGKDPPLRFTVAASESKTDGLYRLREGAFSPPGGIAPAQKWVKTTAPSYWRSSRTWASAQIHSADRRFRRYESRRGNALLARGAVPFARICASCVRSHAYRHFGT